MAELRDPLWYGTRAYMMSARTNPTPDQFVTDLEEFFLTVDERDELLRRVDAWPGNAAIRAATRADIMRVNAVP